MPVTAFATSSDTKKTTPPLVPYRGRATRQRDPRGDRYDLRGAYQHGAGLAQPPRKQAVPTATIAIDDPLDPGKRLLATVNRRADILEDERAHGRISVSQYETARQVQAVFERASGARLGSGGWDIGGSRDQTIAHELAIIYAIEDARTVQRLLGRVTRAVGEVGARFLKQILADRNTFAAYAQARGKGGERGTAQVAGHFRLLLEGLDEAFASRGLAADLQDLGAGETERQGKGKAGRYAVQAAPSDEETDRSGSVVPPGHGEAWGEDQAGFAEHMNGEALSLALPAPRRRDRVAATRRVRPLDD